jgi:hypothetical protein
VKVGPRHARGAPGFPIRFPYAQLSDGVLGPGEPDLALARQRGIGERRLLGEGSLPLRELPATLPPGIPLSVELPMPRTMRAPAGEWARIALQNARDFLAGLEHSGPG